MRLFLKKFLSITLILTLSIPSFSAVSVSDGSAFVSKAEFATDMNNLSSRMAQLENSLDAKIDSLVSSYLSRNGIWNGEKQDYSLSSDNKKLICVNMFDYYNKQNSTTFYYYSIPSQSVMSNNYIGYIPKATNKYTSTNFKILNSFTKSGLCRVKIWNAGGLNFVYTTAGNSDGAIRSWSRDWPTNTNRSSIDLSTYITGTYDGYDGNLLGLTYKNYVYGWGVSSGYKLIKNNDTNKEIAVNTIFKTTDQYKNGYPLVDSPGQQHEYGTLQTSWEPAVKDEYFFVNKGDSLNLEIYDQFNGRYNYAAFLASIHGGSRLFAIQIDEIVVY